MPVATADKKGFADILLNVQISSITLNRTFLVCDLTALYNDSAGYLRIIQIKNTVQVESKLFNIFDIGYAKSHNLLYVRILHLNNDNFNIKFYKQGQRLYYQVNSFGGTAIFIGANIKISEVKLPEDAVEVPIE